MKRFYNIIALLALGFGTLGLIGCTENIENIESTENIEGQDLTLAPLDESDVYFELPEGWEIVERAPGYVRATLDQPAIESGSPFVDLSLVQYRIHEGDDEAAKYRYEDSLCPGSPPCTIKKRGLYGELETLSFDNGVNVYVSTGPLGHWPYEPSGDVPVALGSSLFFAKDGYHYRFTLWDNASYYLDVIEALTNTIRLERRQMSQ